MKITVDGDVLAYLGLEDIGAYTDHDRDVMEKITEMARGL